MSSRGFLRAWRPWVLAAVFSSLVVTEAWSAGASITVTPQTVAPGGAVRVSGQGFPPADRINLTLAGYPAGQVTADERGTFSYSMPIRPETFRGRFPLEATAVGSPDVTALAILTITGSAVTPARAPSPTPVAPRATVTVGSVPATDATIGPLTTSRPLAGTAPVGAPKKTSGSIATLAVIVGVLGLGLGSWLAGRAPSRRRRRSSHGSGGRDVRR